jgi:hypothetical protein
VRAVYTEVRGAAKLLEGRTRLVSLEPQTLDDILETIAGRRSDRRGEAEGLCASSEPHRRIASAAAVAPARAVPSDGTALHCRALGAEMQSLARRDGLGVSGGKSVAVVERH